MHVALPLAGRGTGQTGRGAPILVPGHSEAGLGTISSVGRGRREAERERGRGRGGLVSARLVEILSLLLDADAGRSDADHPAPASSPLLDMDRRRLDADEGTLVAARPDAALLRIKLEAIFIHLGQLLWVSIGLRIGMDRSKLPVDSGP